MASYSADGKDGTAFAFRKSAVACLVRGEWNGGADGEPPIPGEDWYKVAVLCTSPVPAESRREPRWGAPHEKQPDEQVRYGA